jgi:cytosine/uracil/thiamine/allantoin permease
VALFYLGPALAMQSSKLSLYGLAESSLGTILAAGFRLCCVFYLVLWLTFSVETIVLLVYQWPYRRDPTRLGSGLLAAAITLLLFGTALHGLRTSANLARFTNKLSIAILIAALIRVRAGWPSAWEALSRPPGFMQAIDWRQVPFLFFYFAPLALLASDFGQHSRTRKEAALIGVVGLALSFAVSLFVAGFIGQAAHVGHGNIGNGSPVATALFSGTSFRYSPPRMMVTAITMLGSARFGIRALANSIPFESQTLRRGVLALIACCIVLLAVATPESMHSALEMVTRCLIAAAAVFSADFIAGTWRAEGQQKVDWIGVTALTAGVVAPFLEMPPLVESWWYPWLPLSYAVSFISCLILRTIRRLFARRLKFQ